MINKHIELVKKWLANTESVTEEELLANNDSANAAYADNEAAYYAAYYAAYVAAAANASNAAYAEYWLKRYQELTK